MKLVGLSGNFTRPSRTRLLVEEVAREVEELGGTSEVFDLVDAGSSLGSTFSYDSASTGHRQIWDAIRECDALVVGSGVYKASYAGLLKHLFDIMESDILLNKPVALIATAKAPQHALMIDHQFRPLFAFFRAISVPTSIFATDADFSSPEKLTVSMQEKVKLMSAELKRFSA